MAVMHQTLPSPALRPSGRTDRSHDYILSAGSYGERSRPIYVQGDCRQGRASVVPGPRLWGVSVAVKGNQSIGRQQPGPDYRSQ